MDSMDIGTQGMAFLFSVVPVPLSLLNCLIALQSVDNEINC